MNSVCIATYNGEEYLKEQIGSILSQLAPDDEVIISDDLSSDNTVAIIQSIEDSRIKIYVNQEKKGVTANFYNALQKAQGDYIFLADQDDIWLPNKVRRCLDMLQEVDLVVSDATVTDASLNTLSPSLFALLGSREGLLKNWMTCTFYGSCMAFRRTVLAASMPFPHGKYLAHDWWIGMVAECMFRVYFLPEPLVLYRRHNTTVTKLNKGALITRSPRPLHVKILARLQMAYYLVKFRLRHIFR